MKATNPLKAYWQRYVAWFAARQPREKLIVAAAVLGGIFFLGYSHAIEPALLDSRRAASTTTEARVASGQALVTAEALQKHNADPDAPLRAELERMKAAISDQSRKFEEVERSLVSPRKVPALLQSLLARSRTLQLISLHTLPPTPVIERKIAATAAAATGTAPPPDPQSAAGGLGLPNLFKHGVEIRIAGGYNDLLAYVAELEAAPQRLIWGRLELDGSKYPRAVLTLTVYTLSLEKSWLEL